MLLRNKAKASEKMIYLCKKLQVEKDTVMSELEVIMEENLKTQSWLPFTVIKAQIKSSFHLRHHNRME